MSDTHVVQFHKPPAVVKDKKLDMLMVYPVPTDDSPFSLTPLSIMYPGAMFEAKAMRVEYVDLRWDSWEMMEDLIKDSAQIGVSCFTGFQCAKAMDIIERAKQINPKIIVNVGGHHARLCTEDVKREPLVDVVWPERAYGEELFPFSPATHRLWKRGDLQMVTSTGCPYNCLRGDTLVNTVYGDIPISELAYNWDHSKPLPVYTYKDGEVFISNAYNVRKTGENKELVRVNFDDGSHIDCTQDHRFLQFKWGNQHLEGDEWEVQAGSLKPGAHVRALRTELAGAGYAYITWGRRKRRQRSRMVMDYLMGRRLARSEQVHHKDRNKLNDHPENLEYCASQKIHAAEHPEFSERMRLNNPAKNMTPEWRAKITASVTGQKRTVEQRQRYRDSKLGEKNPNFKDGRQSLEASGRRSRTEVNHVVVSVEPLPDREDVYCMEVPETEWFFANDVLVHNCTFCALRSKWNPRDLDALEHQVDSVYDLTGFTEVSFSDPNIGYNKYTGADGHAVKIDRVERMRGIGRILRKHGIRWDGNIRADYITPELVETMAWAGCYSIEFGCESGNDHFLRKVIRKGHGVEDIKEANRCMHGSGISVMNSWVRGMPTETHEQWLDTMNLIDWIMDTAPEARASIYRFTPYPGGPAYDMAVQGIGIEKFTPPTTMRGWGELKLMVDKTYWVAGLNFRMDNTQKNFPGEDWKLIEPYVLKARQLWKERRVDDFGDEDMAEVERLIEFQVRKHTGRMQVAA
jgi:radical SAM superfamily enzyme YgiQ (UPF0313 family)